MRNRTIGYRIIQYVLGFLVNDCIPMDTYMTRDPCENDMFTNSNKAFINFNNFLNKRVLSFTTLNWQQIMNLLLPEEAMNFKARNFASALKIQPRW